GRGGAGRHPPARGELRRHGAPGGARGALRRRRQLLPRRAPLPAGGPAHRARPVQGRPDHGVRRAAPGLQPRRPDAPHAVPALARHAPLAHLIPARHPPTPRVSPVCGATTVTPESHAPTPSDTSRTGPPPGCPAHGLGPGGLRRLHESDDLKKLYEELRAEHGPVAPVLLHDDVPVWIVLGHAENLHMVSTPTVFTRDSRIWSPLREGMVKPDHPLMPHIAWQPMCAHAEGEEHTRLRGAIDSAVATLNFRTLRRHINRATQRIVNTFCEAGEAELVSQYAEHLPMAVMCQILGMPDEYNDRIVQAARDMLRGTETANASNAYIMDALGRLTAQRRAHPQDDFASHLITHPAGLTDDEVREHLRVVLIAAYEATANLLAN